MKSKAITAIMIASFMINTGCIKIENEKEEITLSVSVRTMSFLSSGEQKEFTINSNDRWTISSESGEALPSWISISPVSGTNNGTITVKADANITTSLRSENINIISEAPSVKEQIYIVQIGTPPILTASESLLNYQVYGGQQEFSINSNIDWSVYCTYWNVNDDDWLSVSPSYGSNNSTISVTADFNPSNVGRWATITVTGYEVEEQSIDVYQDGFDLEPEMILVQGGTFTMGCTWEQVGDCYADELPVHQVTLSDYYIGKYEVTQVFWRAVMGTNPSNYNDDNYPVTGVSWDDIQVFLTKLNNLTGMNYRLPTEAEWEYAARGGNSSSDFKYSGSNTADNVAWYEDNCYGIPRVVGGKSPNELGIYDMSGNVYEWCSDWYGDYDADTQNDPIGPSSGSNRVARGGCYTSTERALRVSNRNSGTPGSRYTDVGFRLARSF